MTPSKLRLQVCNDCGTVQYPERDICRNCLSAALEVSHVSDTGTVLALSDLHHSLDPFFIERLPWTIATVQLDCGPTVITHAHSDLVAGSLVRVVPISKSGRTRELAALPDQCPLAAVTHDDIKCRPMGQIERSKDG